MSSSFEHKISDYYYNYCELTIWLKKIILQYDSKQNITMQDVAKDFILERNRILVYFPTSERRIVRKNLNKIAMSYYNRISNWSRHQKITIDMV